MQLSFTLYDNLNSIYSASISTLKYSFSRKKKKSVLYFQSVKNKKGNSKAWFLLIVYWLPGVVKVRATTEEI